MYQAIEVRSFGIWISFRGSTSKVYTCLHMYLAGVEIGHTWYLADDRVGYAGPCLPSDPMCGQVRRWKTCHLGNSASQIAGCIVHGRRKTNISSKVSAPRCMRFDYTRTGPTLILSYYTVTSYRVLCIDIVWTSWHVPV
jgi:hypothetical protein